MKVEVAERLHEEVESVNLVELRFSQEESRTLLRWEHAREFEYLGQMYDIVQQQSTEDSLFVWCYWDQEESRLNQELADYMQKGQDTNPENKTTEERLQDFYQSLFLKERLAPATTQLYRTKQPNTSFLFHLSWADFEPPTPPPRLVQVNSCILLIDLSSLF